MYRFSYRQQSAWVPLQYEDARFAVVLCRRGGEGAIMKALPGYFTTLAEAERECVRLNARPNITDEAVASVRCDQPKGVDRD